MSVALVAKFWCSFCHYWRPKFARTVIALISSSLKRQKSSNVIDGLNIFTATNAKVDSTSSTASLLCASGFLRDYTGNYMASYVFCFCTSLTASFIFLAGTVCTACRTKDSQALHSIMTSQQTSLGYATGKWISWNYIIIRGDMWLWRNVVNDYSLLALLIQSWNWLNCQWVLST